MTGQVIQRELIGQRIGETRLRDVVEHSEGTHRYVTLFFAFAVPPAQIACPDGAVLMSVNKVAGASILTYQMPPGADCRFAIAGESATLRPAKAELELFDGANALVSVRNGESPQIVLDWLAYHSELHGLTAAVILDRAKPQDDTGFADALSAGLTKRGLTCSVLVVRSDMPMGVADMPHEAHPFCVDGAAGKDRMKVPDPDPWGAPLGAISWYEIARRRFLDRARAVANLDVHDLAVPGDETLFDAADRSQSGVVSLVGQQCYPWRLRQGSKAQFGDHICTQFDAGGGPKRWCIAPRKLPTDVIWRQLRIVNALPDQTQSRHFYRHMALRHPTNKISRIVPKTSLVEHPPLLAQAVDYFGHDPVRVPDRAPSPATDARGRCAIVTTMKNEGPFILEWLAFHRAIGFDDFLIYTNDCTDGTDLMLAMLMQKGLVQHRENRFRDMNLRPQHAALQMAELEPVVKTAKWVACIDVDEYVNIKTGDGTLAALFAAVPDANLIAMTWRLFGNADIHAFADAPIIAQFTRCAPEYIRKPHQAWGFKTLFQNIGLFKKLGVHRPKGLNPQLWEDINWVNGSGAPLPRKIYRNGWRSSASTYGYDLVQLNHYAVRSTQSFLVKRDRGRVNHVDRDQGLSYWFRMNNNATEDISIQRLLPLMQKELSKLMADPDIAQMHDFCVTKHREKISELRARDDYAQFYDSLTGARLSKLSRLHGHFGANVFLAGPDVIPDDIVDQDPEGDWFFTVALPEQTNH